MTDTKFWNIVDIFEQIDEAGNKFIAEEDFEELVKLVVKFDHKNFAEVQADLDLLNFKKEDKDIVLDLAKKACGILTEPTKSVFVVTEENCYEGFTTTEVTVFKTVIAAKKYFKELADRYFEEIKEDAVEDGPDADGSEAKYIYDRSDTSFSCWENGCYSDSHYAVSYEKKSIIK